MIDYLLLLGQLVAPAALSIYFQRRAYRRGYDAGYLDGKASAARMMLNTFQSISAFRSRLFN
jgi:hypothetical protein